MTRATDLSQERLDFKVAVLALDQHCIASREFLTLDKPSPCEGELHAHHVITQQQLRRLGLEEFLWDPANGAAICERHHRRHHNRTEPLMVLMLPVRCREWILDRDLLHVLDRYYV